MLVLDSVQAARQQRQTRALEQREQGRELLRADIRNKEVTVASDGAIATTSLLQQLGTPLSSQDVIQRLSKMNRNLVFEVSNGDPSKMGAYVIENRRQWDGSLQAEKRFVCGMERGFMPERSVRHMTKTMVPDPDIPLHRREVPVFTKETRGWRTVLARLLKERLITKPQIERYFPVGGVSRNWQRLTT